MLCKENPINNQKIKLEQIIKLKRRGCTSVLPLTVTINIRTTISVAVLKSIKSTTIPPEIGPIRAL